MSSQGEPEIEVMGRDGRCKHVISYLSPRRAARRELAPTSHGSTLHSRNPVSSVTSAAGGTEPLRAPATIRARGPEGGHGTARMKTRLLTLLLVAGVVVAAMFTAFTIPVAAQQEVVWVQLPTGEIVPVEVPPGTNPADMKLPGPIVPAPTTPAPPPPPPCRRRPSLRSRSRSRLLRPRPRPRPRRSRSRSRRPRLRPSPRSRTPAPAPAADRPRGAPTPDSASSATAEPCRRRTSSPPRSRLNPRMRVPASAARAVAAAGRRCATTTAPPRRATRASRMCCPVRRRRPACRTSSSASSGCRRSCCRSTRRRGSSTASAGRCWRRSTRSRPTTGAT